MNKKIKVSVAILLILLCLPDVSYAKCCKIRIRVPSVVQSVTQVVTHTAQNIGAQIGRSAVDGNELFRQLASRISCGHARHLFGMKFHCFHGWQLKILGADLQFLHDLQQQGVVLDRAGPPLRHVQRRTDNYFQDGTVAAKGIGGLIFDHGGDYIALHGTAKDTVIHDIYFSASFTLRLSVHMHEAAHQDLGRHTAGRWADRDATRVYGLGSVALMSFSEMEPKLSCPDRSSAYTSALGTVSARMSSHTPPEYGKYMQHTTPDGDSCGTVLKAEAVSRELFGIWASREDLRGVFPTGGGGLVAWAKNHGCREYPTNIEFQRRYCLPPGFEEGVSYELLKIWFAREDLRRVYPNGGRNLVAWTKNPHAASDGCREYRNNIQFQKEYCLSRQFRTDLSDALLDIWFSRDDLQRSLPDGGSSLVAWAKNHGCREYPDNMAFQRQYCFPKDFESNVVRSCGPDCSSVHPVTAELLAIWLSRDDLQRALPTGGESLLAWARASGCSEYPNNMVFQRSYCVDGFSWRGGVNQALFNIWLSREDLRNALPDGGESLVTWAKAHGCREYPDNIDIQREYCLPNAFKNGVSDELSNIWLSRDDLQRELPTGGGSLVAWAREHGCKEYPEKLSFQLEYCVPRNFKGLTFGLAMPTFLPSAAPKRILNTRLPSEPKPQPAVSF